MEAHMLIYLLVTTILSGIVSMLATLGAISEREKFLAFCFFMVTIAQAVAFGFNIYLLGH